jgi:transcriptional regulator with XRE-family HTH domain
MEPSGGDIGLAVMIHRELAGMKGTELAAESSVSDKTISVWKKGNRTPSRKLVQKVAVALKIPLAEIDATASWVVGLRLRRAALLATPQQLFLEPRFAFDVQEVSALRSLSKDQLIVELGRARDRQLEIEAELAARRPPEGR